MREDDLVRSEARELEELLAEWSCTISTSGVELRPSGDGNSVHVANEDI